MYGTKDGNESGYADFQPTDLTEPNWFRDFTFHSNMYNASNSNENKVEQREPKVVGNLQVRRVAK